MSARLRRVAIRALVELPWLAAIGVAWWLLWRDGAAFVSRGYPYGHAWWDGLITGWEMLHGGFTQPEDWRRHLYHWVLALLGERHGYVTAGIYLSSLASYLIVIGAALGGRGLGGPGAAALAALSVPLVRTTLVATHWVTFYPLLAGATALAVGLGACLARWPRWWLAVSCGLATALAMCVDLRGTLVLPINVALLAIGLSRSMGWRRRVALALLFAVALLPDPWCRRYVDAPLVPVAEQAELQREVAFRWIWLAQDRELERACRDFMGTEPIPWSGECARELLRFNLGNEIPKQLPFLPWLTLAALPLALLPGRGGGWRASLASALVLGAGVAALLGQGLRIPLPPRYVIQFAGFAALVVPVALSRLARTALPRRWGGWGAAALALAGLVALWTVEHPARDHVTGEERNEERELQHWALDTLRTHVAAGDALLDCSDRWIAVGLLPQVGSSRPMNRHREVSRCRSWAESPPATGADRWLLTDAELAPPQLGYAGWELVESRRRLGGSVLLWRWAGDSTTR